MSSDETLIGPLQQFVEPMIDVPAWGVKKGYGSFLTFEFGEPKLHVQEPTEKRLYRLAYVEGQSHLWINCCNWRVMQDGNQIAWSEDANNVIDQAAATLNGQKLVAVAVGPKTGHSSFAFDLGGSLETWPYGEDPTDEQWIIHRGGETFAYRGDGKYSHGASDTLPEVEIWSPLG